jgi:hypothetical protein
MAGSRRASTSDDPATTQRPHRQCLLFGLMRFFGYLCRYACFSFCSPSLPDLLYFLLSLLRCESSHFAHPISFPTPLCTYIMHRSTLAGSNEQRRYPLQFNLPFAEHIVCNEISKCVFCILVRQARK